MTTATAVLGIITGVLFYIIIEFRGKYNSEKLDHELTKEDRDFYKKELTRANDSWEELFEKSRGKWEKTIKETSATNTLLNERVTELLKKELQHIREINIINARLQGTAQIIAQYELETLEEKDIN